MSHPGTTVRSWLPCRRSAGFSAPMMRPRLRSGSRSRPISSCNSTTSCCANGRSRVATTPVRLSGVVTQVRARHEGARFDSDVFLIEDGVLPAQTIEAAEVLTTRVEPEVFVPPTPGHRGAARHGRRTRPGPVLRPHGTQAADRSRPRRRRAVRRTSTSSTGTRGAHVNISGISGVATKTTYATFLLYSLFNSGVLGDDATNTHALDLQRQGRRPLVPRPRQRAARRRAARSVPHPSGSCPGAFKQVDVYAPPRKGDAARGARRRDPPAGRAQLLLDARGVHRGRPAAVRVRRRRRRPSAVHDGRAQRVRRAAPQRRARPTTARGRSTAARCCARTASSSTSSSTRSATNSTRAEWAGTATGLGTVNAFVRRLLSSQRSLDRLVRADVARAQRSIASRPTARR